MLIFICVIFLHCLLVDGTYINVESKDFPFQVSLRLYSNGDHHCSGVIIDSKHLLTAAHCVCLGVKHYDIYAVLGADSYASPGDLYETEKVNCHPFFTNRDLSNDIAVLKLKDFIQFSYKVQPLIPSNIEVITGEMITLALWKYRKNYVIDPPLFQLIQVQVISNENCTSFYNRKTVTSNKFCTSTAEVTACIGDSGGPAIYKNKLVGLISFGMECILGYPNVHTKISNYIPWIIESIAILRDNEPKYKRNLENTIAFYSKRNKNKLFSNKFTISNLFSSVRKRKQTN